MIKKENIEFRYYEMPPGSVVLALLGEKWIGYYGNDSLHFHNYLEIGLCYYGRGHLVLGDKAYDYRDHMVSVIPRNYPHRTCSKESSVSRWEYLFVDVEGFLREIYKDKPMLQKILLERINQGPLLVNREEQQEIGTLVRLILDEMRDRKELYQEAVRGCLQA